MIQFGTPNTGKTCAMPWASAQPATTYATATLYTLRRFSSPKKVFGFTLRFCATRHLQAMYIVGQPRRLTMQGGALALQHRLMSSSLFVRPDLLRSSQQLLEIGAITNGIPDWINFQTSDRHRLACRDRKQMSKSFDRFLGSACARFDLREASLKICTREGVLLDWH